MAEIRWSVAASRDLKDIEDWIARDSILHAVDFIDRLIRSVEKLKIHPRLGRVVPEFERRELREIVFGNFRIVYLMHGRVVTIVRVAHGSRDLGRLL